MSYVVRRIPKVRWFGEGLCRMWVRSEGNNDPEEYLVDLEANPPTGWCGCADFDHRRRFNKGMAIEHRQCKHIKTALIALGTELAKTYIRKRWKELGREIMR